MTPNVRIGNRHYRTCPTDRRVTVICNRGAASRNPLAAESAAAAPAQEPMDIADALETLDDPSGSVSAGDVVRSEVTVHNTGTTRSSFFMGYSAIGPEGGTPDNDGTTGRPVTLEAWAETTVPLEWRVGEELPGGQYGLISVVWLETDPEDLHNVPEYSVVEEAVTIEPVKRLLGCAGERIYSGRDDGSVSVLVDGLKTKRMCAAADGTFFVTQQDVDRTEEHVRVVNHEGEILSRFVPPMKGRVASKSTTTASSVRPAISISSAPSTGWSTNLHRRVTSSRSIRFQRSRSRTSRSIRADHSGWPTKRRAWSTRLP